MMQLIMHKTIDGFILSSNYTDQAHQHMLLYYMPPYHFPTPSRTLLCNSIVLL